MKQYQMALDRWYWTSIPVWSCKILKLLALKTLPVTLAFYQPENYKICLERCQKSSFKFIQIFLQIFFFSIGQSHFSVHQVYHYEDRARYIYSNVLHLFFL